MNIPTPEQDVSTKKQREFSLFQLLPNVLTITAICAGLTAIRVGVEGHFTLSVQLILIACVLDGLDGRLARLLSSDSKMGAELDSLADFLNFGVATPLIVYFWALQDIGGLAWISALVFSVCCVMRLARFNVGTKSDETASPSAFFEGIPSPAGALLAMLPMYYSFAFPAAGQLPDVLISLYLVIVGLLLISRIPTWSFKATKVSRDNVKFFLVGVALVAAGVLTYAWVTLMMLCLGYVIAVLWGLMFKKVSF